MRVSLVAYLHQRLPEVAGDAYSVQFSQFLRDVYLEINPDAKERRLAYNPITPIDDYHDALRQLPPLLKDDGNVGELKNELAQAAAGRDLRPQFNRALTHLANSHWRHLYQIMGRDHFITMIINHKGFVPLANGTVLQVFGPTLYTPKQKRLPAKRTRDKHRSARIPQLTPSERDNVIIRLCHRRLEKKLTGKCLNAVFRRFIPRKPLPPIQTCDVIASAQLGSLDDDDSFSVSQLTTTNANKASSALDYQLLPKKVIGFVLEALRLVVPPLAWGSLPRHRRKICNLIHRFLTTPTMTIAEEDVTQCFLPVFKKPEKDYGIAEFWLWVFRDVLAYILRSLVRAAELKSTIIFVEHAAWNRLLDGFIDTYAREFLIPYNPDKNDFKTSAQKYNFGRMRLQPKTLDFRLICIPLHHPWTNLREAESSYFMFRSTWITPISKLLQQRIAQRYHPVVAPCKGTSDLASLLAQWKLNVTIPRDGICFLKVDFAKCYDRLDHDVIIDTLAKLFDDVDDNHVFYCDTERQVKPAPVTKKRLRGDAKMAASQLLEADNTPLYQVEPDPLDLDIILTQRKNIALTKGKVLQFCELTVRDGFMYDGVLPRGDNNEVNYRAWKRKKGVFQGFPLLATFCELVLSDMVVTEFESWLHRPELLVLRVVDDLLFVSTDKMMIQLIYQHLTSDRLAHYGIKINREKTQLHTTLSFSVTHIDYLGAEINPYDLSVNVKTRPKLDVRSFTKFYKQLLFHYTTTARVFDQKLKFVLDAIKRNFSALQDHDEFQIEPFIRFIRKLINSTKELDGVLMATLIEQWLGAEELRGASFAVTIGKALAKRQETLTEAFK